MIITGRAATACAAVREAGKIIRSYDQRRERIRITTKDSGSLVSNADLAAEKKALTMIAAAHPDDGYLSEESGAAGRADRCWVLDPLDGTNNFVHGLPDFCVSLAYCLDGVPELGAIYDVCRDDLYFAARNRGTLRNERRIQVSQRARMADALIASTGSSLAASRRWSFLGEISRRSAGLRRSGSAALDLAMCASGAYDAAFGARLNFWDYAAGCLMILEAGGEIFRPGHRARTPLSFGERLDLIFVGAPRIVGGLRRMLAKESAASSNEH